MQTVLQKSKIFKKYYLLQSTLFDEDFFAKEDKVFFILNFSF